VARPRRGTSARPSQSLGGEEPRPSCKCEEPRSAATPTVPRGTSSLKFNEQGLGSVAPQFCEEARAPGPVRGEEPSLEGQVANAKGHRQGPLPQSLKPVARCLRRVLTQVQRVRFRFCGAAKWHDSERRAQSEPLRRRAKPGSSCTAASAKPEGHRQGTLPRLPVARGLRRVTEFSLRCEAAKWHERRAQSAEAKSQGH
jgi:hypothetical protein